MDKKQQQQVYDPQGEAMLYFLGDEISSWQEPWWLWLLITLPFLLPFWIIGQFLRESKWKRPGIHNNNSLPSTKLIGTVK